MPLDTVYKYRYFFVFFFPKLINFGDIQVRLRAIHHSDYFFVNNSNHNIVCS